MTKILKYILLLLVISGCSLNDSTGFWSKEKNLKKLSKFKSVFQNDEVLSKEFNNNFILAIDPLTINYNEESNLDNNDSYKKYIGNLKKISKYNFSKIDNYEQIEPEPIFFKDNVIFFDNKGTIFSFDHSSKLIWKRNIYSKNEKK